MKSFLCAIAILCMTGCASMSTSFSSEEDAVYQRGETIHALLIKDGSRIVFDEQGGSYTTISANRDERAITGSTADGEVVTIAARDVVEVELNKPVPDASRTVAGISLAILATALFWLLQGMSVM